jgi:glutamate racemase
VLYLWIGTDVLKLIGGGNVMDKLDLVLQEIQQIKLVMATKEDIANMATKEDIANMATKEDIANMATKEDIANMATKADIANMATKEDITNMATKEDIAMLDKKIVALEEKFKDFPLVRQAVLEMAKRMTTLEDKLSQIEQHMVRKEDMQFYDFKLIQLEQEIFKLKQS